MPGAPGALPALISRPPRQLPYRCAGSHSVMSRPQMTGGDRKAARGFNSPPSAPHSTPAAR